MESDLLNRTESISSTAFLPQEFDLLKDAEIFTALESDLWNVAEQFSLLECYLLKLAEILGNSRQIVGEDVFSQTKITITKLHLCL